MRFIIFLLFLSLMLNADSIVPVTEKMEPWQIKTEDGLEGISVDVVKEIQKRIGNTEEILLLPWNRGYNMTLRSNEFALFLTARSEKREELFEWVGPIVPYEVVFYKHIDNKKSYKSLDDAKNAKSIAVTKNDVMEQYFSDEGFENLKVSFGQSAQANFELLLDKSVELLPISSTVAEYRVKKLNLDKTVVKTEISPLLHKDLYIAFNKNTPKEVVKRWRDAFEDIKNDGTLEIIINRYK